MKKKRSKRHHYIPKFLIKEFTDEQGLLYIYDKIKDKFLTNKRSPKSIFFENDRNTIVYDESKKTSLIEDDFFMELDNISAKIITIFQKEKNNKELLNVDNLALLDFFIINLFWRLFKMFIETLTVNDKEHFLRVFDEIKNDLAAIIIEPVAGNMGFVPADKSFLELVREVSLQNNSILIFDEVMSGFRVSLGKFPKFSCNILML